MATDVSKKAPHVPLSERDPPTAEPHLQWLLLKQTSAEHGTTGHNLGIIADYRASRGRVPRPYCFQRKICLSENSLHQRRFWQKWKPNECKPQRNKLRRQIKESGTYYPEHKCSTFAIIEEKNWRWNPKRFSKWYRVASKGEFQFGESVAGVGIGSNAKSVKVLAKCGRRTDGRQVNWQQPF